MVGKKTLQQKKTTESSELSEEFELTANSLGAHMKVTESSPSMGHSELILKTFILLTVYSQDEITVSLL